MHIRAYAKLNPFLDITGKRDDGYHNLSIVFRPVSIYDLLDITIVDDPNNQKIYLTSTKKEFENENNIIFKAYDLLVSYVHTKCEETFVPSFRVRLIKNIPSGAGMAGGSTDAAAFLVVANKLANLGLTTDELIEIGSCVGADVPACILKSPSVAVGIGEKLRAVPEGKKVFYIVVKPEASFNTGEMYGKYDELLETGEISLKVRDARKTVKAIRNGKLKAEAKSLYNVFEKVVPEKKLINKIKKDLVNEGALGALLTGSGSCVFGMFKSKKKRDKAYKKLAKKYNEIYKCESINEK